jgi:fructokinase
LVFGESLFDHFADGTRLPGGAPFNVAWHLRGFETDPLLVTAIGKDREGKELLEHMNSWRIDTSTVQIHPNLPTGRVTAHIRDGQAYFHIEPRQAYDEIFLRNLHAKVLAGPVSVLYHGTLGLRGAITAETLDSLKNNISAPRLVDVNLRDPWWNLVQAREAIQGAEWLKVSDEEAGLLTNTQVASAADAKGAAETLRRELNIGVVVITRGVDGAMAFMESEVVEVGGVPVADPVDTVGAGDAFCSVLILGIERGWSTEVTLTRATEFAAEICRRQGATSAEPDLYARFLRRWVDVE